jgi:hypothetical protein
MPEPTCYRMHIEASAAEAATLDADAAAALRDRVWGLVDELRSELRR